MAYKSRTLTAVTLVLLSVSAQASVKSASDLASLCADESQVSKQRCLGYIQGYLDAFAASNKTLESSDWRSRAIDTRIGTKLKVRYGYDREPEFCANGIETAKQIKLRLLSEPASDEPAVNRIEEIAREVFPCSTT